jgi:hypothetical protein
MSNLSSTRPIAPPPGRRSRPRISLSAVAAALGLAATLWATLVGRTLPDIVRNEGHQLAVFRTAADRECVQGIPRTTAVLPSVKRSREAIAAADRVGDRLVHFASVRPPEQYAGDYRALVDAWRDVALGLRGAARITGGTPAVQKAWEKQERRITAATGRIQTAALPMGLFGCSSRAAGLQVAASQSLLAGRFRVRGRHSAATVRG